MLTWRQRTQNWLISIGAKLDSTAPQSRRYVKYISATGLRYYHLGKAGAVLISTDGAVTHAVSITDQVHRAVVEWESQKGGTTHE